MKHRWFLTLLLMVLLGVGCANTRKFPAGQDYYSQAENFYNRKLYKGAIDNYQHLIDQYPFSAYADDAELKIGLAYYQMQNYPEAINALTDFVRMHPTNKNLPMASYYLAPFTGNSARGIRTCAPCRPSTTCVTAKSAATLIRE